MAIYRRRTLCFWSGAIACFTAAAAHVFCRTKPDVRTPPDPGEVGRAASGVLGSEGGLDRRERRSEAHRATSSVSARCRRLRLVVASHCSHLAVDRTVDPGEASSIAVVLVVVSLVISSGRALGHCRRCAAAARESMSGRSLLPVDVKRSLARPREASPTRTGGPLHNVQLAATRLGGGLFRHSCRPGRHLRQWMGSMQ